MAGKLEIFNGIVELAKAGYKPSDVKDILESLKTDPELEAVSVNALTEKPSDENKTEDKTLAEAEAKAEVDAIQAIIERNNKGE